jgi:hypothetical protein
MIMGMEFLHSTKFFALNKHRPETIHVPVDDDFEVMAINNPRRRLRRHLDSYWCIMPAEEASMPMLILDVKWTSFLLPYVKHEDSTFFLYCRPVVVKFADESTGDIFGKSTSF